MGDLTLHSLYPFLYQKYLAKIKYNGKVLDPFSGSRTVLYIESSPENNEL